MSYLQKLNIKLRSKKFVRAQSYFPATPQDPPNSPKNKMTTTGSVPPIKHTSFSRQSHNFLKGTGERRARISRARGGHTHTHTHTEECQGACIKARSEMLRRTTTKTIFGAGARINRASTPRGATGRHPPPRRRFKMLAKLRRRSEYTGPSGEEHSTT